MLLSFMNRVVWTQINKTYNRGQWCVICVRLFCSSVDSIRGNEAKHKSYGFASWMSSMASKSALREMQTLLGDTFKPSSSHALWREQNEPQRIFAVTSDCNCIIALKYFRGLIHCKFGLDPLNRIFVDKLIMKKFPEFTDSKGPLPSS
jgi:hypothetical protein